MNGGFITEPLENPERWAITLLVGDEFIPMEYVVATNRGQLKAVALATAMHVRRMGQHVGVHDVVTELLGTSPIGPNGRPEPMPGDLSDYMEVSAPTNPRSAGGPAKPSLQQ